MLWGWKKFPEVLFFIIVVGFLGVACAGFLFGGGSGWRGRLRTRYFLLFSFWRLLIPFLGLLRDGGGGSAHAISCFSFFDVCSTSLPSRSAHVISRFSAFYSRLFIFIHSFSFSFLTIVNIRDNMCTSKNERRCFYVY